MKYILLILILLGAFGINAQNAPISLIPATETYADSMPVEVLTRNFNDILSLNLQINYDTVIAEAISITAAPGFGGNYNFNISQQGTINIGWYTSMPMSLPNSTPLFNILFIKKESGNLQLTFYDNGYSCTFSDASYNTLNDIPTGQFYISSSNIFLSSTPPAPAGPISGQSTVCPLTQTIYSIDSIPGATGYNWYIPLHTAIVGANNTQQITLQFAQNFTGGTIMTAGTNIFGQGTLSPPLPIQIPESPAILLQPTSDTVTAYTTDTATFKVELTIPPNTCNWQENNGSWHTLTDNEIYTGTNTTRLTIHNATPAMSGNHYRCQFTDTCNNTITTDGESMLIVNIISNTSHISHDLQITASPNPFTSDITISIPSVSTTTLAYTITTLTGIIVKRGTTRISTGTNQLTLSLSELASGIYLLQLATSGKSEVIKIAKR